MGLAVAKNRTVLTRPLYGENWDLRPDAELQSYLKQILDYLENRIYGAYLVYSLVFGYKTADRMAQRGECTAPPPGQRPQDIADTLTTWSTSEDWFVSNSLDALEEPGDDGLDHQPHLDHHNEGVDPLPGDEVDPLPGDEESIIGSTEDEQVHDYIANPPDTSDDNNGEEMDVDEVSMDGDYGDRWGSQSESDDEDNGIEGHQFNRLSIGDTDYQDEDEDDEDDEDEDDDTIIISDDDEEIVSRGMKKRKRASVESNQSVISRDEQVKRKPRRRR